MYTYSHMYKHLCVCVCVCVCLILCKLYEKTLKTPPEKQLLALFRIMWAVFITEFCGVDCGIYC